MSAPRPRQVLLTAFVLAASMATTPSFAQSIAVVVNGQPILSSEVQARVALMKLTGGKASPALAQQELIDDKLKASEAKRYGITASDEQVETAFAAIAQRVKLPPEQFTKAIAQRGVSADTLKSRLRSEIAWGQLVRRKFSAQIASRERDAMATNSAAKVDNKAVQYTLRQVIFVIPKGATDAQMQQRRTEAVAARLRFPGCDQAVQFASSLRDVAVKEPVVRSSAALGKEMTEMLGKTKLGGLTDPQRGDQGFEMIAVCDRKDIADDNMLGQAAANDNMGKQLQEQADKYLAQIKSRAIVENR